MELPVLRNSLGFSCFPLFSPYIQPLCSQALATCILSYLTQATEARRDSNNELELTGGTNHRGLRSPSSEGHLSAASVLLDPYPAVRGCKYVKVSSQAKTGGIYKIWVTELYWKLGKCYRFRRENECRGKNSSVTIRKMPLTKKISLRKQPRNTHLK